MQDNPTADKIEAWKKKLNMQAAAQASKRYRQRNQAEYNQKARLRMARRRQNLSAEDIEKRNEKARTRYRDNRSFVLGTQQAKREQKQKQEGRQTHSRRVMPMSLFDVKDRGGQEYEIERLKWRSQVLGERQTVDRYAGTIRVPEDGVEPEEDGSTTS
ncbi:hypothetical protein V5O48_014124 [Marasmius crinis-equi]|uniref:Uncharacterized protein n=1 Tax=Marasmius crinis-equi TaxID=585013 RepID=A0ABR3EY57_9AGAR